MEKELIRYLILSLSPVIILWILFYVYSKYKKKTKIK